MSKPNIKDMAKYVYICGPVTDRDYDEAKAQFDAAAYEIKRLYGDAVKVVNPFDFCQRGEPWSQAMRKCITKLMECDYIHVLPGWMDSRGARLEMNNAFELGFGLVDNFYQFFSHIEWRGQLIEKAR